MSSREDALYTIHRGEGPLLATALHCGHALRGEVAALMALDEAARLREEDPYTDRMAEMVETRIIPHRSRFEVDLNRPRHEAVYRVPEDAWGLEIWREPLPQAVIEPVACPSERSVLPLMYMKPRALSMVAA